MADRNGGEVVDMQSELKPLEALSPFDVIKDMVLGQDEPIVNLHTE